MRYLLILLCLFCATSVASAKPLPKYKNQPTTLNALEPLPAAILTLPMADYTRWAKAHNKLAHEKADYRAREYNKRYPRSSITVITTEYEGTPLIEYGYRAPTRTTIRRGIIRQTYRTYRQPPWGGGPIILINPYYRSAGD